MRRFDDNSPQPAVSLPAALAVPDGVPDWITVDLIRQTLETWQHYYQDSLSVEDAITMILNVGQLFRVLGRS
jgi:hypothetical protein